MLNVAEAFHEAEIDARILTKLDGDSRGGAAYLRRLAETHCICFHRREPEDFELLSRQTVEQS